VITTEYGYENRTSLWGPRWPFIALQECIDVVAAADREHKEEVRYDLPCDTCHMNTQCLTAKEKEVGGLMFDREYHTKPRAASSSLFPFERMEPCLHKDKVMLDWYKKPLGAEERYATASGYDIAWSERAGGDYFAVVTAVYDRVNGTKTIIDIDRWQRMSFQGQMELIESRHSRYREDIVVIETDAAQEIWRQYLSATTAVPVLGHTAGTKRDFEMGVPSLLRDIERRAWVIPYKPGSYKIDMVKAWLAECEAFGWIDDKLEGVGEHDDLVMAWWHCDFGLNKMRNPIERQVRSRPTRREL